MRNLCFSLQTYRIRFPGDASAQEKLKSFCSREQKRQLSFWDFPIAVWLGCVLFPQHTRQLYLWARTRLMTAMTASGRFESWPRGGGRMSLCWGWITSSARSPSRTVSGEVAGNRGWQEIDARPGRLSHCGDFPFIIFLFLSDGLLGPCCFWGKCQIHRMCYNIWSHLPKSWSLDERMSYSFG